MIDFLLYSIMAIQLFVFFIATYYLLLSFFGLRKKDEKKEYSDNKKRFALIVAAYNEELVIGNIIDSLKEMDYPKDLYEIFVVADNCTDKTADIAREHGSVVFERINNERRGKGYALDWAFNKIFEMENKFDAVVIFDADNLASRNFLREMERKMNEGYKIVQGYIDSKNPHDSWITEAYSISFWSANRLFQLARHNLKLSNQIGGTGFCVDLNLLKNMGWGATCLTEDLEFTCRVVLKGYRVGWAHDAVVYDEKPLTLRQSIRQRKRWMQGFADVASRFFFKLVKKAIFNCDFTALDCALYTIQPFIMLLSGLSIVLTFIQNSSRGMNIFVVNSMFNPLIWKLFSAFQFIFTPFVMLIEKKLPQKLFLMLVLYSTKVFIFNSIFDSSSSINIIILSNIIYFLLISTIIYLAWGKSSFKIFLWYLLYGFYTLTWIPITITGIIDKNKREWCHTKHTRQISIKDMENIDGRSAA